MMGVRATVTIVSQSPTWPAVLGADLFSCQSVKVDDRLWGIIVCHSHGERGMRIPLPVQEVLRLLSQTVSRSIESLDHAALHMRPLVSRSSSRSYTQPHPYRLTGRFNHREHVSGQTRCA